MSGTNAEQAELGPASRDREARMRAMTEAAVDLFSEEGYGAVSTRRIAERAGCSETLLFRYFGDKRGLLLTICNNLASGGTPLRAADECRDDVGKFIEQHLLESLANVKAQAPALKVVIAALINDPAMTGDFEQRHIETVEYVAAALRGFRARGVIAESVDIESIATAIEQLSFSVGFMLQLVLGRPKTEIRAIAQSCALVLSQGLQADAPSTLTDPRRRKAMAGVADARSRLDAVMALLTEG